MVALASVSNKKSLFIILNAWLVFHNANNACGDAETHSFLRFIFFLKSLKQMH